MRLLSASPPSRLNAAIFGVCLLLFVGVLTVPVKQEATAAPRPFADQQLVQGVITPPQLGAKPFLAFDDVTVERTADQLLQIDVTVRNLTDQPQSGRVWYYLSEPGNREPWATNTFRSNDYYVTQLAPDATQRITLAGFPVTLPIPQQVSLWLYRVDEQTGDFTETAKAHYFFTLPGYPDFSVILYDTLPHTNDDGSTDLYIRTVLSNNTDQPAALGVFYTLALDTGAIVATSDTQYVVVDPVDYYANVFHISVQVPPDRYYLSVTMVKDSHGERTPVAQFSHPDPLTLPEDSAPANAP